MVGILLPPSIAGALVNFAVLLAWKSSGQFELHADQRRHCVVRQSMRYPDGYFIEGIP